MRSRKSTVPENMIGTLALTDYNSAHTLSFTKIMYEQYTVAILENLTYFLPIN